MDKQIFQAVKEYNSGVAKGAKGFKVSQVDERHATIELSLDGIGISMNYPRDKDSVFFITEPEWLGDDLNAQLIGGKLKTLDQILAAIARKIDMHNADSSGGGSGSEGSDLSGSNLGQSVGGLGVSGFYEDEDSGRHYALSPQQYADLKKHVEQAQEMLGQDRVQMVEDLGSVKMTLNMFEFLDATLAEKLGFYPTEPVFLSFCYEKSAIPTVSCTQRLNPDYGVKNHLKSILDHFFYYWNNDRAVLLKVGRPPKELANQISSGVPSATGLSNDNNAVVVEPPKEFVPPPVEKPPAPVQKKTWWKGLFGKSGGNVTAATSPPPPSSSSSPSSPPTLSSKGSVSPRSTTTTTPTPPPTIVVSEEKLAAIMDLGFDAIASTRALLESNADADKATMALLGNPDKYRATNAQLKAFETVYKTGPFPHALAAAAVIKHDFDTAAAAAACQRPVEVWTVKGSPAQGGAGTNNNNNNKKEKPSKKKAKEVAVEEEGEEAPPATISQENVIFSLLTYLQERLGHYSSYCVSCNRPHSCWNPDGGVVCCEALCVFQLEGSPMEKLVSVRQCPFQNCETLDLSTAGKEFMGLPLQQVCKDYNITSQQLLEMILHKYLPPEEMKKFLNDGLKLVHAKKVESCLNPALCARFEHAWKKMRENRPDMKIVPRVAYHGTSEAGVQGISSTGFLISKLSQGSGDNGWYGCGIYLSQNVQTAMGYCRGKKMLVCAVLMGKIYKCPGRMDGAKLQAGHDSHEDPSGYEWVIYDEAHILPAYVVHL